LCRQLINIGRLKEKPTNPISRRRPGLFEFEIAISAWLTGDRLEAA
jgi:hypothetical protein